MVIDAFEVDGFAVACHGTMSGIAAPDWDACGTADHPLLQHRHLRILEDCGLAVPAAGFHPHHLLLRDADGAVVGAAPVYLKTSSLGEMGVDLGLPLAHGRAAGPPAFTRLVTSLRTRTRTSAVALRVNVTASTASRSNPTSSSAPR